VQISDNENITDHYRRYMDLGRFSEKLGNIGLRVLYCVERKGLAIHGDEDPTVIRIVAEKMGDHL
jgi:hypothetical protein